MNPTLEPQKTKNINTEYGPNRTMIIKSILDAPAVFKNNPSINRLVLNPLTPGGRITKLYRILDSDYRVKEFNAQKVNIRSYLDQMGQREIEEQKKCDAKMEENKQNIINNDNDNNKPVIVPKQSGRGRPRSNIVIAFPAGEFTVAQLAKDLGLQNYQISNEVNRLRKLGENFQVVKTIKSSSGRGKPTQLLKLVNKVEKKAKAPKAIKTIKAKVIKVKTKKVIKKAKIKAKTVAAKKVKTKVAKATKIKVKPKSVKDYKNWQKKWKNKKKK